MPGIYHSSGKESYPEVFKKSEKVNEYVVFHPTIQLPVIIMRFECTDTCRVYSRRPSNRLAVSESDKPND